jgi:hypothetical protein
MFTETIIRVFWLMMCPSWLTDSFPASPKLNWTSILSLFFHFLDSSFFLYCWQRQQQVANLDGGALYNILLPAVQMLLLFLLCRPIVDYWYYIMPSYHRTNHDNVPRFRRWSRWMREYREDEIVPAQLKILSCNQIDQDHRARIDPMLKYSIVSHERQGPSRTPLQIINRLFLLPLVHRESKAAKSPCPFTSSHSGTTPNHLLKRSERSNFRS